MRVIADQVKRNMLNEQFIPDHLFIYIVKGEVSFFDGHRSYTYTAGECCIARKDHLVKFMVNGHLDDLEPILFCFDTAFLQLFQQKHASKAVHFISDQAVMKVDKTELIDNFIQSLKPYYKGVMQLDEAFEDVKYEELLIILLRTQPELSGIFFDFDVPQKINLEAFMNRNFRFNVSIQRFAFLTGRSISAFKRDFKEIFDETPSRWLVKKRLQEAYFLMSREGRKPSDIYLDLGFESLSHFSVAFKKEFGVAPTFLF